MGVGKKIILTILAMIAVADVGATVFFTKFFLDAKGSINQTYVPVKRRGKPEIKELSATEPFSVLLLGIDSDKERQGQWAGRSDAIMVVTVNPKQKQTTVLSIQRDLLAQFDGPKENEYSGTDDKINHAFARGGAAMSMDTVSKLLDLPINHYIAVNMEGLADLVDAVGGIEIDAKFGTVLGKHYDEVPVPDDLAASKGLVESDVSMTWYEAQTYGYDLPEEGAWQKAVFQMIKQGKQHMDGRTALNYARFRHEDGEEGATNGRDRRQREVVQKLVEKLFSLNSIPKYHEILKVFSDNLKMDFNFDDLVKIRKSYPFSILKNVVPLQLQGEGEMHTSLGSIQLVPKATLLRAQNYLRAQMELPKNAQLKNKNQPTFESEKGVAYQGVLKLGIPGEKEEEESTGDSSAEQSTESFAMDVANDE